MSETETECLRRDAARYRYLRDRDLDTIKNGGIFAGSTPDHVVVNKEDLDRRIDAAIAEDAEVDKIAERLLWSVRSNSTIERRGDVVTIGDAKIDCRKLARHFAEMRR